MSFFPDLPFQQQPDDGTGQPSQLGDTLALRRYLGMLGYPTGTNAMAPIQPNLIPTPGLRLGPVHLSGQGLDSAALSVLGALQGMPRPQGFGANFGTGLAMGLAGGRARQAETRAAANQAAVQSAAKANEDRQSAARAFAQGLANHRYAMEREKMTQDAIAARSKGPQQNQAYLVLDTPDKEAAFRSQYPDIKVPPDKVIPRSALFPTAGQRTATETQPGNEAIDPVVEQIYNLKHDPTLGGRVTKESTALRKRMAELHPDFNWSQRIQQWNDATKFINTAESQRFRTLRTSAVTFSRHLQEYEDFNKEFDQAYRRLPQRIANKGIMWAATNGWLGQNAAAKAAALVPIRGAVGDELSTLLAGGYAPQKEQIASAHKAVDLLWSPRQQTAAIKSIKQLVEDRVRSAQEAVPWGKDNPYMLDVTPINVFGKSFGGAADSAVTAKPGGAFDQMRNNQPPAKPR